MKTHRGPKKAVVRTPNQKVSLKIRDSKVTVRIQQPVPQNGFSLRWSTQ